MVARINLYIASQRWEHARILAEGPAVCDPKTSGEILKALRELEAEIQKDMKELEGTSLRSKSDVRSV
ncbi:MAG: hypothetical protein ABI254_11635 [Chthoniobacterales bacterium]